MKSHDLRARRPEGHYHRSREARSTLIVVVATVAALGGIALAGAVRERSDGSTASVAAAPASTVAPTTTAAVAALAAPTPSVDLAEAVAEDCTITAEKLSVGDSGVDVKCLQQGLATAGYYSGEITGTFGPETFAAVETLQEERKLFVDGVVGRETAISVGVWPDEESFVIRTPPPPEGAEDAWGYPLSSVAVTGAEAPPVPPDSGSGKRVVYERRGQRVWAIDENDQVIRSWLVAGSKYGNEQPGFHKVYSRSEQSTAWNQQAFLPLMIRYQETHIGHIGFHGIPIHVSDGSPYMTEAELGTRLSGGCQRQANRDAAFMWAFADVGTTVVVI